MTRIIKKPGAGITICLLLLSTLSMANVANFSAKDLTGSWKTILHQKGPNGKSSVTVSGTITYFVNGTSRGNLKIIASKVTSVSGQTAKLFYQFKLNGKWSVNKNLLTETIVSVQGGLYQTQTGLRKVDLATIDAAQRDLIIASAPKLKNSFQVNIPGISAVTAFTRNNVTVKTNNGTIIQLTRNTSGSPALSTVKPALPSRPATPPTAVVKPPVATPVIPGPTVTPAPATPTTGTSTAANFYGTWKAGLTKKDPASGNLTSLKGTVTYKADGTFSTQITVTISGVNNNVPFELTYKLSNTGIWTVANNVITETTTGVTSAPVIVKNGTTTIVIATLPVDQQAKIIASLPNLNSLFPKNVPDASKIVKVAADEITIMSDGETLVLKRVR